MRRKKFKFKILYFTTAYYDAYYSYILYYLICITLAYHGTNNNSRCKFRIHFINELLSQINIKSIVIR